MNWETIKMVIIIILIFAWAICVTNARAGDFPEIEESLTGTNTVTDVGFKDPTDWTSWNKFWFGGAIVGNTLDTVSTMDALDRGCYEKNPLLGEYPDDFMLVTFKVAVMGISWLLVENLSKPEYVQRNRNIVYGFQTVVMNTVAVKNYNLDCQ